MTIKKLVDLFRPSEFLNYPIMGYGVASGVVGGWIKLWSEHTYDDALVYGLSMGLAVILGVLTGTQVFYRINALFLRYIRAVRSDVECTLEPVSSYPVSQASTQKTPFPFRAVVWGYVMCVATGAVASCMSGGHLVILLVIGSPDWAAPLFSLFTGLGILVLGLSVGLLQCRRLELQAKRLRRITVEQLSEFKVAEPVSDGTEVVAVMRTGEKWVGTLTGVRGKALTVS